MTIDLEGLDESLDKTEDNIDEVEILETIDDGRVTVWMLSEIPETDEEVSVYSEAFENFDIADVPSELEVMNAAMEYASGRTFDGSMSLYDSFLEMEKTCTVLNRPIEVGRAAGCISSGGCAMILGDQATIGKLTGADDLPVVVGGIGLLPVCAAGKDSVQLLWKAPIVVEDSELKEMGCRLVEVYK